MILYGKFKKSCYIRPLNSIIIKKLTMKKFLLFSGLLLLSLTYSQAQIIVYVESPASAAGSKPFTWADPPGGWGTQDLNIPANAIKDTLMLVDDGTAKDSLGCTSPLVSNLTGKIAVVYRGDCEFGVKAKNAQDAGAVGVIIINNAAGAPVGMGPGAQGASVTIPTVMVSNTDGAVLNAAMNAGPVVVFIGNKLGLYANDLGLYAIDLLIPRATANPQLISTNATEFNVPMGGWIHNYGTANQTNVSLAVSITGAATYSAASTPVNLNAGDSVYAVVPTYTASSYSGFYNVDYSVTYGNADDFNADNVFNTNFLIDSLISYCKLDPATQLPKSTTHLKVNAAPLPAEYKTCIHFMDPNASRLSALGLYTSATTTVTLSLAGESVDILAYEWNDAFTGLSDPAFPASPWTLVEVGQGTYQYQADLQGEMVYIPFITPVHLKDNQRYLFCNRVFSQDINLGFDANLNYLEAIDTVNGNDQPVSIIMTDADQFATGFGTDNSASVSVLCGDMFASVNEADKSFDVTPFPNPTRDFIKIPLKGMNGTASLKIVDLEGREVNSQTVKVAGDMTVNVAGISNGNYVFNLKFEDGRNTTFKVVISK